MHRSLRAVIIGSLAILALAPAAIAGGWAHIQPDQGAFEPPAGTPTDLGFTVLQHGVTPVSWVHPSVVIDELTTGTSRTWPATQSGAEGHFIARVTLPTSGLYRWNVTMPDLVVEGVPTTFIARESNGAMPDISPIVLLDLAAKQAATGTDRQGVPAAKPPVTTDTGLDGGATDAKVAETAARADAMATSLTALERQVGMLQALMLGMGIAIVGLFIALAVVAWPRRRSAVDSAPEEKPSETMAFGR